jgi:hypothetical protein
VPSIRSGKRAVSQRGAGFDALWISDHFHPWLDEPGQSGSVWSVIGAISQVTSLPIISAVTSPLLRQHPAIVAQAAPASGKRRSSWRAGWPTATCAWRRTRASSGLYRESGGGGRPVQGGLKVCWSTDEDQARKTMHRLWPNDEMPGEAAQLLPLPRHFGQLAGLISEDMISAPCGPDPAVHIDAIRAYTQAGFDEVYIGQVGTDHDGFFDFYAGQVLPRLREE